MQILTDPRRFEEAERLYISVREKEGRVYTDEEVTTLPAVVQGHRHHAEWVYRAESFSRLQRHLRKDFGGRKLRILDIGCGNGWMTHRLNEDGHYVTGLDTNLFELKQGKRVFGESGTLKWVYADVLDPECALDAFDVILLSASCQYFPDLGILTKRLETLLLPSGQVHLLDSMFYDDNECIHAKERTIAYYTDLGFPGMSIYYYHHKKQIIKALGYHKLYPQRFSIKNKSKLEWWFLKK